ncbi:MAG TPA: carbon monoxide dehydrogenase [Elusimicrobia bacterium]|jgi:CO dehydrogenase maturation factor|nr:carbon monoxide dehydrogenase [Elusimicrobiota bacterium]
MTIRIAVAGKGGTGKSTFVALLIYHLIKEKKVPILAVDADPNSNLNELLGLEYKETVADIREQMRDEKIPPGMSKPEYLDYSLEQIKIESKNLDLLVMGHPEGQGCYCFVNELLRNYLSRLSKNYYAVVMDNEAGMEHLSRRTTDNLDYLFILSEPTVVSIRSAVKIYQTAKQLKLKIDKFFFILNFTLKGVRQDFLIEEMKKNDLSFSFFLPKDEEIRQFAEKGKSIFNLSAGSPATQVVAEITKKIIIGN